MSLNTVGKKVTWTLQRHAFNRKNFGDYLTSDNISMSCCSKEWNLQLYPKGSKLEFKDFVSIFLSRKCLCLIQLSYSLGVTCKQGDTVIFKVKGTLKHTFLPNEPRWGFPRLAPSSKLNTIRSAANIVVKLKVLEETKIFPLEIAINHSLAQDVEKLICDTKLTDICISCGGGIAYEAHRVILSARSKTLAETLKDNTLQTVSLKNISPKILEEVLMFIYTDNCPNLGTIDIEGLLVAASDLKIPRLMAISELEFIRTLNIENVARRYGLAATHNLKLKEMCLKFILTNARSVRNTAGWITLAQTHPSLILEAFNALATKFP